MDGTEDTVCRDDAGIRGQPQNGATTRPFTCCVRWRSLFASDSVRFFSLVSCFFSPSRLGFV